MSHIRLNAAVVEKPLKVIFNNKRREIFADLFFGVTPRMSNPSCYD